MPTSSVYDRLAALPALLDEHGTHAGRRKAVALGAAFGDTAAPEHARAAEQGFFDGIPTMVTPRELRMLLNFFAVTPMDGPVLEIGSYLVGSTAAIATGLATQGFRGPFHVLDSFAWDAPAFVEVLKGDVEKLRARRGLEVRPEVAERVERGDWFELFADVHRGRPYAPLLRPMVRRIPNAERADDGGFDLAPEIPRGTVLSALFIDGFKSWPSTQTAMRALLPMIGAGTVVIFQDFSWYDCYWLPILANHLSANLSLVMKVDNTAIFRVADTAGLADGLDAFGDGPAAPLYQTYLDVLTNNAAAQFHSGDEVGFLGHTAQSYVLSHGMRHFADAAETLMLLRQLCSRIQSNWLFDDLADRADFSVLAA